MGEVKKEGKLGSHSPDLGRHSCYCYVCILQNFSYMHRFRINSWGFLPPRKPRFYIEA